LDAMKRDREALRYASDRIVDRLKGMSHEEIDKCLGAFLGSGNSLDLLSI
jgi:hypothetical protein